MDKAKLAAAFNEWMRRYTEQPEEFEREWRTVSLFLKEQQAELRRGLRRVRRAAHGGAAVRIDDGRTCEHAAPPLSWGDETLLYLAGFAEELERHAAGARELTGYHDGFATLAQHCEAIAHAARQAMTNVRRCMDWHPSRDFGEMVPAEACVRIAGAQHRVYGSHRARAVLAEARYQHELP